MLQRNVWVSARNWGSDLDDYEGEKTSLRPVLTIVGQPSVNFDCLESKL